ncbi:unnamed protein product [Protopolystoma xenopodis]|uniref:Reverse transcriptase domain-containing protein n=1 Tax=Protopolystoma xenopodis TaxID=117903 RepID=A0A3S5ARN5_9PLAT|nr:unnamed protein product [Protopolystoma xenopodis]
MYTKLIGVKAVTALLDNLEKDGILATDRMRRESLTRLINLTIRTTYFTSNGRIYEQSFGLPMSSPLSPLLANIFMDKVGENFEMSPQQPTVIMRYLDD